MLQWGDYASAIMQLPGNAGYKQCGKACSQDERCKAWTFIKTTGQCRLKFAVGEQVANSCCVSGIKQAAATGSSSGSASKQRYCADYATAAVEASDRNLSGQCGFKGARWDSDYDAHFNWCLGSTRDQVDAETNARSSLLTQCLDNTGNSGDSGTGNADQAQGVLCAHYARVSVVQSETNIKAACGYTNPKRWQTNPEYYRQRCNDDPSTAADEVASRETYLRKCFERAGSGEQACNGYADEAVKQYQSAAASGCGFPESRRWSAGVARHYAWCLAATDAERQAESKARAAGLKTCVDQKALQKACVDYSAKAIEQARKNLNGGCGFDGPRWSVYKDDHNEFCMQASAAQRLTEVNGRQTDLQRCLAKPVSVSVTCDRYAKQSVEQNRLNIDKRCKLGGDEQIWSADYSVHYDFCLAMGQDQRLEVLRQRNDALAACGQQKGLRFDLQFNFQ